MEAKLKTQDLIIRDSWDDLVRRSPQGNFYALSYYMDVVAPGWMGIEVVENGELVAVMPLYNKRKMGLGYSLQPPFVQHWGVFFEDRHFEKAYTAYSWKRKVLELVIGALPKGIRWFGYGFAPEFDYALPFHWMGCTLRTRYTYRLDLDVGEGAVHAGMKKKKKHLVKQAAAVCQLSVAEDGGAGILSLIDANLAAGRAIMSVGERDLAGKIIRELRGEGRVLEARDQEGRLSAAAYVVDFGKKTTLLLSASDPSVKDNGAQALVLWEAIRSSAGPGRVFDFEGSMIEGVELFFRGYGAVPIPYLFIEKNDLPLLVKWIKNLR